MFGRSERGRGVLPPGRGGFRVPASVGVGGRQGWAVMVSLHSQSVGGQGELLVLDCVKACMGMGWARQRGPALRSRTLSSPWQSDQGISRVSGTAWLGSRVAP